MKISFDPGDLSGVLPGNIELSGDVEIAMSPPEQPEDPKKECLVCGDPVENGDIHPGCVNPD